uniref:Glutathione S-transferase n=1 Tax=Xenopus tropicalis TaxID=8364 RepID=A0A803JGV6_XENTR
VSGYTLTYFPVRGRAEAIRLLLADQGVAFKDEEAQIPLWFAGKDDRKKHAVFGQLPQFKNGDYTLYQSNSILRYLGRKHGLNGSNDEELGHIDMVNDGVEDLRQKYVRLIFTEYDTGKDKYLEALPQQLEFFERILSKNHNGSKFIVGQKISYADYNLLDLLHCHLDLSPKSLSAFPLLSAYVERLNSRPKLNEYLKSEARNRRPITPKHK